MILFSFSKMLGKIGCLLTLVCGVLSYNSYSCNNEEPSCSSFSGCCCSAYSSNDPWNPSYLYCPCMVTRSSSVQLGEVTRISCNPGFTCYDTCQWLTPQGSCTVTSDRGLVCDGGVTGITFQGGVGSCDIDVLVESTHMGNWTCLSRAYINHYSSHIVLTETSGTGLSTQTVLLAIVLPIVLVVVAIIVIIILVCCCCPGVCGCCPSSCCAGRRKERNYDEIGERRSGTAIPRNPDREPVYDRPGSAYTGQLDTRSDGSSSGRPDSRQGGVGVSFSLQPEPGQQYAPQDLYRQVEKQAPRYPARTDNRYPSRTENRYPYPTTYTSNSPPPVIYSEARLEQDAAVTRTARKVSSHIGADLDDRIRKVSGVNGYY